MPKLQSSLAIVGNRQDRNNIPECLLDTTDVIFVPVSLRNFFLSNGNTTPAHSHDRNIIHIVLVKVDLKTREMSLRPLVKSPALYNLGGFDELEVLSRNVATEKLELAALLRTFKELGGCTREGSDSLWISKGLI